MTNEAHEEQRNSWHMDKRITIGLIVAVLLNIGTSVWQSMFVLKTLDTDPPIVERIIRLEFHASEQGRVNQKILNILEDVRADTRIFRNEQSRRTPMINYIENLMGAK